MADVSSTEQTPETTNNAGFPTEHVDLKKASKFVDLLKLKGDNIFKGRPADVVIPIMGPTGVGKSTFINHVIGRYATKVGHGLKSETAQLNPVVISYENNGFMDPYRGEGGGRLVLVDTPGFDDTYVDEFEILRRISVWLAESYTRKMKLGGVIYLHDITQTRMLGTTRRNLTMFQKLVGLDAMHRVVLGTTKWLAVEPAVGEERQRQLGSQFWKEMTDAGSKVEKIDTRADPNAERKLVQSMLDRLAITESQKLAEEFLQIQHEIVGLQQFIPETDAGQTLKYTLKELLDMQEKRAKRLKEQMKNSDDGDLVQEFQKGQDAMKRHLLTIAQMKTPLSKRFRRLLSKVF